MPIRHVTFRASTASPWCGGDTLGMIVLMVGIILSNDWYAQIDNRSWQVVIIRAMFFSGFILSLPSLGSSVA